MRSDRQSRLTRADLGLPSRPHSRPLPPVIPPRVIASAERIRSSRVASSRPAFEDEVTNRSAGLHRFLGDLRRRRVADVRTQRRRRRGAAVEQFAGPRLVRRDAVDARGRNTFIASRRIVDACSAFQAMTGIITFSSSWPASHAIATVVSQPDHLEAHLIDHLRDRRIHLARHDRRARLHGGQRDLGESGTRSHAQQPQIARDLADLDRKAAHGARVGEHVAATLAAWVNYICPVEGAKQAMEKIDSSLVDNELIFPSAETLAKAKDFMGLDQKTEQELPEAVRCGDRSLIPMADAMTPGPAGTRDARSDAGADLTLTLGHQEVRRLHRRRRPRPGRRAGPVLRAARAVRAAARPRRCGWSPASRSPPAARSPIAGQDISRLKPVQAAGQHGVPELRAVPAPRHLRERRVRAAPPRRQGRQEAGRARCSSWSSSAASASAAPASSPAASSSASPWPGR